MELAREIWTDERLDDLVRHMDEGFARLDGRIEKEVGSLGARLDKEISALGARIDRESASRHAEMQEFRGEMNARFNATERRFDSLHRTMLIFYGGIVLALVGVIAGLH
jgi:hypothetical protein